MMLLARSPQPPSDLKTRLEDACEGGKIYEWRLAKAVYRFAANKLLDNKCRTLF